MELVQVPGFLPITFAILHTATLCLAKEGVNLGANLSVLHANVMKRAQ